MENNSLITGRIPVGGLGIHKTYEESFFHYIYNSDFIDLFAKNDNPQNVFFLDVNNELYAYNSVDNKTLINNNRNLFRKVTVINITQCGSGYLAELIETSILHNHLVSEKIESEKQMSLSLN